MLQNRVSDTISHVTLKTMNGVLCLPFTNVYSQSWWKFSLRFCQGERRLCTILRSRNTVTTYHTRVTCFDSGFVEHIVSKITLPKRFRFRITIKLFYGVSSAMTKTMKVKVDVPKFGQLHLSGVRLGVDPRTDTKKHVFRRDWTPGSKYDNHSRLNSLHSGTWEDVYDRLMSTRVFTLTMNKIVHMSSENYEENGYGLN